MRVGMAFLQVLQAACRWKLAEFYVKRMAWDACVWNSETREGICVLLCNYFFIA